MSYTIERKRSDCPPALPKGWQREEVARKTGLSAGGGGKMDTFYYSPPGKRIDSKAKLKRQMATATGGGNRPSSAAEWSAFVDYQQAKRARGVLEPLGQHSSAYFPPVVTRSGDYKYRRPWWPTTVGSPAPTEPNGRFLTSRPLEDMSRLFKFRHHNTDVSLVPPIRQTASIFKQPVTVYKQRESIVKTDLKHGISQEKPKQLFWEKRLEGLRACDKDGVEFAPVQLPKSLRPCGPGVDDDTLLQSVATALHCTTGLNGIGAPGGAGARPIVGQTATRQQMSANPAVFLNPQQPLMQAVEVNEDDIRRQEDRVGNARKRLQEFMKA